jgi:hypothetical protein
MATYIAAGCSAAQVQAAVDLASSGDIVVIPAGAATWTIASGSNPAVDLGSKAIHLQGNGIGSTVITLAITSSWGRNAIAAANIASGLRISGIEFNGTSNGSFGAIMLTTVPGFRIDHCKFDNITGRCIFLRACTGLIDNCSGVSTAEVVYALGDTGGGSVDWAQALDLGGSNAVYIEDCTFPFTAVGSGVVDAVGGARVVFRYNTIANSAVGNHGLDSNAPPVRSTYKMEIYENVFTNAGAFNWGIFYKGGTGVIFNNTFTGTWGFGILTLACYRACGLDESGWLKCDGTRAWDGNSNPGVTYGWPARDQIGRGKDASLWAQLDVDVPQMASFIAQDSVPLYQWNNKLNGTAQNALIHAGGCSAPSEEDMLVEGRDYYDQTTHPTYVSYTYPHPLQGFNPYMRFY